MLTRQIPCQCIDATN